MYFMYNLLKKSWDFFSFFKSKKTDLYICFMYNLKWKGYIFISIWFLKFISIKLRKWIISNWFKVKEQLLQFNSTCIEDSMSNNKSQHHANEKFHRICHSHLHVSYISVNEWFENPYQHGKISSGNIYRKKNNYWCWNRRVFKNIEIINNLFWRDQRLLLVFFSFEVFASGIAYLLFRFLDG